MTSKNTTVKAPMGAPEAAEKLHAAALADGRASTLFAWHSTNQTSVRVGDRIVRFWNVIDRKAVRWLGYTDTSEGVEHTAGAIGYGPIDFAVTEAATWLGGTTADTRPAAKVRTIESFEAECEACDWHGPTVDDDVAAQALAELHNREEHA